VQKEAINEVSQPEKTEKDIGEFEEKVVMLRRVFTVVKGGRRIGFNALVVVGNRNGLVGSGLGKGKELLTAIQKGRRKAKKDLVRIPIKDGTIPYQVMGKYRASRVLLKPASSGTGVIAGGAVRAVVELAGIKDILTKTLGSNNPINVVKATLKALESLKGPQEIIRLRKGEK